MANKRNTQAGSLSPEERKALFNRVEISVPGDPKTKTITYEEKEIAIIGSESAKHMIPGKEYIVGSNTAIVLIEKGYATLKD